MRFEKKIERIEYRHFGNQINFNAEFARFFRKHQARQVIRLRVLLPIDEMSGRRNAHRIRQNARAAVGRRPQTHDLRAELDQTVVAVMRDVIQRNMDRHCLTLFKLP